MDLAQSNARDRDAALLRASTELFFQVDRRSADEVLRYGELAIHLLAKVDARHRAFVAEQLAERNDAPKTIVLQLAKDLVGVATPVLRHSPLLNADDLLAVIAATGTHHHRLIARRDGLDTKVIIALTNLKDPSIESALAKAVLPAAPQPPTGGSESGNGAIAFLALEREQRLRAIASQASRRLPPAEAGSSAVLERFVRRAYHAADIAMMARTGRKRDLIGAFADGLALDPGLVNRLIADATGEGLVLMCKAIGLGEREARQVLLLANPQIGQSTEAFFRLADLHAGLERDVAERIIASWRGEAETPVHRPFLAEAPRTNRPAPARPGTATRQAEQRPAEAG